MRLYMLNELIDNAISLHKMIIYQNIMIIRKPRKFKYYTAKKRMLINELLFVMDMIDSDIADDSKMNELNELSKSLNILEHDVIDIMGESSNLEYIK